MTKPELDIILLTHNHVELTIKAVGCLYRYTKRVFRLTVIDDSTDETEAYFTRIGKERNNIQYFRPKEEIHGANHAINIGLEITNCPIFCFLGNSTFVEPHWLDSAYNLMTQRKKCGVVGFKILNPIGTIQSTAVMGVFANGMMAVEGKDEAGHRCTFISHVPAIGGCLFLARREAVLTLDGGKLDTGFFPWRGWNDLDFCLSLGDKGWEVVYCGYGSAYHVDSPTKKGSLSNPEFTAELEANRKKVLDKWPGFRV